MSAEEHNYIVRSFVEGILIQANLDMVDELAAPDLVVHDHSSEAGGVDAEVVK